MALSPTATKHGAIPGRPLRAVESVQAIAQHPLQRFADIPRGEPFWTQVKGNCGDGSFVVEVNGLQVRMRLPNGYQPGDRLQLTLLTRSPQLTFGLRLSPKVDIVDLTSAGQAITRILRLANGNSEPASIAGSEPIVSSPTAQPLEISQGLRDRLARSGLFYESHVAEWATGSRSLDCLSGEPQQRLTANTSARITGVLDAAAPETELARLVDAQLGLLEQQRIVWRGDLWAGQPVQWEVEKHGWQQDSENTSSDISEPAGTWTTAIRLELPALGEVSARLRVKADRLQIEIQTADSHSRKKLMGKASELVGSLHDSGFHAESLSISQRAEP
jgi:hypothetical protein